MSEIVDKNGRRYRLKQRELTLEELESIPLAPHANPEKAWVKQTIIDAETRQEVTDPIDMGNYLLVPHENGPWRVYPVKKSKREKP